YPCQTGQYRMRTWATRESVPAAGRPKAAACRRRSCRDAGPRRCSGRMDDAQRDQAIADLLQRVDTLERLIAPRPTPVPERRAAPPKPSAPAPDFSWLVGPRGFALAGAVVTILGLGFLFALATSRGWVGPAARCAFRTVFSLLP